MVWRTLFRRRPDMVILDGRILINRAPQGLSITINQVPPADCRAQPLRDRPSAAEGCF